MEIIQKEDLKKRLESGEQLNLVDVREPDEHAAFNIGGMLLPLGKILSGQIEDLEEIRDREIICYCRSGQRSMQACLMLESMGFAHVRNLAGGMLAWQADS
jgi:rhodanese-related sulfurtransferase